MFDDIKVTNEGIITLDAYAKFKINVIKLNLSSIMPTVI
jgi:hypothetical protein